MKSYHQIAPDIGPHIKELKRDISNVINDIYPATNLAAPHKALNKKIKQLTAISPVGSVIQATPAIHTLIEFSNLNGESL